MTLNIAPVTVITYKNQGLRLTLDVVPEHLKELCQSLGEEKKWPRANARDWFSWVIASSHFKWDATNLPLDVDRQGLKEMVALSNVNTIDCCASVLAWGGMNRMHGSRLFKCKSDWISLSEKIRSGAVSRSEAYDEFAGLRNSGQLSGMGPAYFTKLIFFLMPESTMRGYIMDQWTARSVNLLSGKNLVRTKRYEVQVNGRLRTFETVSDQNTSRDYENFCVYLEELSQHSAINVPPEDLEQCLFSNGRGKGRWRTYVKLTGSVP